MRKYVDVPATFTPTHARALAMELADFADDVDAGHTSLMDMISTARHLHSVAGAMLELVFRVTSRVYDEDTITLTHHNHEGRCDD